MPHYSTLNMAIVNCRCSTFKVSYHTSHQARHLIVCFSIHKVNFNINVLDSTIISSTNKSTRMLAIVIVATYRFYAKSINGDIL